MLNDKFPFVRREAVYALGEVGSVKAIPALVKLLDKDKDKEVKAAIVVAFGKIGNIATVSSLNSILRKKPKFSKAFMRRSAARSIGQIAQKLQSRKRALTTPESFLPPKYKTPPPSRTANLTNTFPVFAEVNKTLVKVISNKKETDDVRREASFALGEIGNAESIEQLKKNLNSEDYYLVEISKEALLKTNRNNMVMESNDESKT